MTLIFFFKMFEIKVDFINAGKISEKILPSEIIAFKLVAVCSPYYRENTFPRDSMC